SQKIEEEAFRIRVQSAIFYNLARAHIKAHGVDGNVEHLNQAIELLNKSVSQTKDPKDQEQAKETIAAAQEILDGLEGPTGKDETPEGTPDDGSTVVADPTHEPVVDEPLTDEATVNKPMRIGGFALIGAGVLGG